MKDLQITCRHSGGWTLIELMVVVAVLFALLAIAIPATTGARAAAWAATCRIKLGQTGAAFFAYGQDNRGFFPVSPVTGDMQQVDPVNNPYYYTNNGPQGFNDAFYRTFSYFDYKSSANVGTVAYAKSFNNYVRDPGDRDMTSGNDLNLVNGQWYGRDYVLNQYVLARTNPPFKYNSVKISSLAKPSQTYVVACGGYNQLTWVTTKTTGPLSLKCYHGGNRQNVLFADQHVEVRLNDGGLSPTSFPYKVDAVNYPETVFFWNK